MPPSWHCSKTKQKLCQIYMKTIQSLVHSQNNNRECPFKLLASIYWAFVICNNFWNNYKNLKTTRYPILRDISLDLLPSLSLLCQDTMWLLHFECEFPNFFQLENTSDTLLGVVMDHISCQTMSRSWRWVFSLFTWTEPKRAMVGMWLWSCLIMFIDNVILRP